jgi:hypothetical protein
MILNEVMKETADAIREKTGKSELIKPVDFASEIKGITVGGGSAEGGSNVEYLDVRASGAGAALKAISNVARFQTDEFVMISPTTMIIAGGYDTTLNNVTHIKVDWGNRIVVKTNEGIQEMSLIDFVMVECGIPKEALDSIPRITKEQFYDLNA